MRKWMTMALVIASGACLISQPPGDPPPADSRRPLILHDLVKPKLTEPITSIQPTTSLEIVVEADPQVRLEWRLFLDFDPVLGGVQLNQPQFVEPDTETLSPTRSFSVGLFSLPNFDTSQCHSLTLRIAERFSQTSNWTPIIPPGGDDATWFYRPNGTDGPCPGYDAGSFPDAAAFDTGAE